VQRARRSSRLSHKERSDRQDEGVRVRRIRHGLNSIYFARPARGFAGATTAFAAEQLPQCIAISPTDHTHEHAEQHFGRAGRHKNKAARSA